jgi:hypothetical protein
LFGASARKKPGDADRERAHDREVPRQERVLPPGDGNEDRDQDRVDRLRDEEVRRALDVRDHTTAFGHNAGQRRELAVEQHELRDRARRRGARAHGNADVGVPSMPSASFTPSPVIRDDVAGVIGARRPSPAFCCGVDATEGGGLLEHVAIAAVSSGRSRASNGVSAPGRPTRWATAPTVRGLSPRSP